MRRQTAGDQLHQPEVGDHVELLEVRASVRDRRRVERGHDRERLPVVLPVQERIDDPGGDLVAQLRRANGVGVDQHVHAREFEQSRACFVTNARRSVRAVRAMLRGWGTELLLSGTFVPHPPRRTAAIARVAARQYGLVTVAQLRAAGLGRNAITLRVQAGPVAPRGPGRVRRRAHRALAGSAVACRGVHRRRGRGAEPLRVRRSTTRSIAIASRASTSSSRRAVDRPRARACIGASVWTRGT